ncbi:MAG: M48 family metalloprotease, partial [Candidatus Woesearchaeota archaeon]
MSQKRDFYTQIRINNIKTLFLFFFFFVLIIGLGWLIGFIFDNVYAGIILTAIIAVIYSVIVFFAGDRMVLALMGAKPANRNDHAYYINTVEGLAIAAGIPTPKAYIIETDSLNAFATGRNPEHAAVTVTTGLLKKLTREELEGVVAHEVAHIKNYDIRTMLIASILVGVVILLSDFIFRIVIFGGGSRRSSGDG